MFDAPAIDLDWNAGERGHAIDQQQRVTLAGAQRLDVIADAGRRLRVHDGNDLRRRMRLEHARGIERAAPLTVDADHLGAAPRRHVAHPLAEQTVDSDDHHIAAIDRVDEGGFHAG